MDGDSTLRSMLAILLATCETALDASRKQRIVLSEELVADLESVARRTRTELDALADPRPPPA
jgi:hypothetical protein